MFLRNQVPIWIAVLAAVLISPAAPAEISWASQAESVEAAPGHTSASAVFMFRNAGSEPIRISDVNPSCSCTAAVVSNRVVGAGESGSIHVVFNLQGRTGRQRQKLEVSTSDGRSHQLFLDVDIPLVYELSARRAVWPEGDLKPRTVTMVNRSQVPIDVETAESAGPAASAVLQTVRKGFEYVVVLTPDAGAGPGRAVVSVTTQPVDGQKPLVYRIYAQKK